MSQNHMSYSGITTKSRAMQAKLFHKDRIEEIIQSTSVREFVMYLKSSDEYRDYFETVNENNIHRGQVEHILKTALYQSFESLYQFSDREQRKQLDFVYDRYEISVLSDCLKKLFSSEEEMDFTAFQTVLAHHIRIPVETLIHSNSLEEFVSALKGTPYEKVFHTFLHEERPSLFDLQMHLNNYYYKSLWRKKDKVLTKEQQIIFNRCIGTRIDVQNIMNIYRCKKYYQIAPVKIISILIPVSYRLKREELSELVNTASIPEFMASLQKTNYKISQENPSQDDFERIYSSRISRAYAKSKCKAPLSIAPILNFLYQKERELDNLTTVLEGIRYGMKQEAIRQYLMD